MAVTYFKLLSVKTAQTCILNESLDCTTKIIELMLLKEVSPQLRLFDQKYSKNTFTIWNGYTLT